MRPQRPSANKTRAKIIAAAKKCFLKKGFAGTPTQLIADTAKVNQTLLFHHFKNKENLWREVKASIVEKEMANFPIDDSCLQNFVTTIVKQRIHIYKNNPDLVQLMKWQLLEDASKPVNGTSSHMLDSWRNSINKLKDLGEINKAIDIELIVVILSTWVNGIFMQKICRLSDEQITQYEGLLVTAVIAAIRDASFSQSV